MANSAKIRREVLARVASWPADGGECKPSAICSVVAQELSGAKYHDCVDVVGAMISSQELKLDPGQRGLFIPQ